jgi:hypothetical protein
MVAGLPAHAVAEVATTVGLDDVMIVTVMFAWQFLLSFTPIVYTPAARLLYVEVAEYAPPFML